MTMSLCLSVCVLVTLFFWGVNFATMQLCNFATCNFANFATWNFAACNFATCNYETCNFAACNFGSGVWLWCVVMECGCVDFLNLLKFQLGALIPPKITKKYKASQKITKLYKTSQKITKYLTKLSFFNVPNQMQYHVSCLSHFPLPWGLSDSYLDS